jgi:outer membrane receptor protein involved in Fe transport
LNNVVGQYKPEDQATPTVTDTLFIKDLKVADAPQSQLAYAVSVFPVQGLYMRAQGRTYWNHYAEFNPANRTDRAEQGVQSWKVPGYSVFDLHAAYRIGDLIPAWRGGDVRVFANVYNIFDELYISDAVDDSSFNGYGDDGDNHDSDSAEVFLGWPRTFNLGFEISF